MGDWSSLLSRVAQVYSSLAMHDVATTLADHYIRTPFNLYAPALLALSVCRRPHQRLTSGQVGRC